MEVNLRACKRHCYEFEHLLDAWVHAAQSDRRTVGGAYSFDVLAVPVVERLRLEPTSPRVDRSLRLPCEVVGGGGTVVPSTAPKAAGGGSGGSAGRGGLSEGVDVGGGGGGGVGVALVVVDNTVCCVVVVAFKLTFFLCQRPCIDLLRAIGP